MWMDARKRGMLRRKARTALHLQLLALALLPACVCFSGSLPALRPARARGALDMPGARHAQMIDGPSLQKTEYVDSKLSQFLQGFFEEQLSCAAASGSSESSASATRPGIPAATGSPEGRGGNDLVVFDRMIGAAFEVARLPGAEARDRTLQLLNELFPAWFLPSIKGLFALFPLWFVARHASFFSVILTYWLVGKCEVQDVDPALLDPDTRAGWGNTPVGWVPGFALGDKWRPEVGASQGVLVERCRVLETSGCASVCANVCKAPTQHFFTDLVGLPLTMVPDFETQSCSLIFGATPPPLEEDKAFMQGCLVTCALVNGDSSRLQEAEVERRLEAWRQSESTTSCPL